MQKKFSIEVDCANCAAKVEAAVAQILKEVAKAGRRIDPDFAIDF